MCPEQKEFSQKLIEMLLIRTNEEEMKWDKFVERDYSSFSFLENVIRFNEKCNLPEYPDYFVDIDKSIHCKINYGPNYNKTMNVGLIYLKKTRMTKETLKVLVCCKEETNEYRVIADSKSYDLMDRLYEVIEFKNIDEFRILSQWMKE